jgi:hypothetical protein
MRGPCTLTRQKNDFSFGESVMMKHRILATMTGLSVFAFFTICVNLNAGAIAQVPEAIKVQASQKLTLEAQARGVQIYECKQSNGDPTRLEWAFRAPEADLFDRGGKHIGKHYAGPTWESNDGSKVVGEFQARADGPDPDAIPWLLLRAKSTSGSGVFSGTHSIQRVRTSGGKAPAACSETQVGKEARIPYEAVYDFYSAGS